MKAKLVENIDFKRGQDSKEALDLGSGIVPAEILVELKRKWIEEYKDSLRFLIGKKVKLEITSHPFTSWDEIPEERIITVKDIHHSAVPEKNIIHDFIIEDIEDNQYRVAGHKTIKILEE